MGQKVMMVKVRMADKGTIRGRVGHTRTGACTSKGKCNHGLRPAVWKKGGGK